MSFRFGQFPSWIHLIQEAGKERVPSPRGCFLGIVGRVEPVRADPPPEGPFSGTESTQIRISGHTAALPGT